VAHVRVLPRAQRRASRRSSTCTDVLSIRNSLPSAAELVARMYRSNVAFKQLKHASESPTRLFSACTCVAGLSYSMNVLRRSHAPYIRMPLLRRFLAATSTADGFFDRRKRDALQIHLRASSVNRRTFAIVQLNNASASSLPARVVLEQHARTCAVLCRRRVVSSPLLQPRKGFFDARDHDPAASVVQMCRSRLHCHFSSRSNMRLLTKPTEACSTSDGREMPPARRRVRFDGGVIPDVGVRVYAKSLRMGWSSVRN